MNPRFDTVIGLLGSPRRFSDAATTECVDLMREFLRREALWATAFGIADDLPFADMPGVVSPDIHLPAEVVNLIEAFSRSTVEEAALIYMLKWYQVPASQLRGHNPALPTDPYLPLLKLFELGGFFTREHRIYIDVNRSGGLHSGMVQNGSLDTPFAAIGEE